MVDGIEPITIVSARADGVTSLTLGLAAVLGAQRRTVVIDLNLENSDVAPFVDLEENRTIYHLAYSAQLAPIGDEDLRQHLQWHDGFAVLAGIAHPQHREHIQPHFLGSLIHALQTQFETVLIDGGRLHGTFPPELTAGRLLWVLSPRPLGMAAFDRVYRALEETDTPWLERAQVVLNRVSPETLTGVGSFIRAEYGLTVLGEVSDCPRFWSAAELTHSLRALYGPLPDRREFVRAYGEEALRVRTDVEALAGRLALATPVGAATS
jgi:MinD-like ATPase involved in chromosome partitioning or flagellar assembly